MTISISDPLSGDLKDRLTAEAGALGFSVCRIADAAAPWPAGARLAEFLDEGRHGDMDWMTATADRRAHPTALWPEARSAVMLGLNYGPKEDPLEALSRKSEAAISVYAQGRDYHELIKPRLKRLAGRLAEDAGADVKVFVDTAPLMEKPLAERAGIGWQGKHTNLVSRAFGSWLFLGAILTDAVLDPDPPETDHCGQCRACLDICPTDAFPAPYQLDARRCLSYLTIEHKGPIPRAFRKPMGNRVYGCDDCLAVCPWNKFASHAYETALHARVELRRPALADLVELDEAAFRDVFKGSPIKRTGRERFVRNVLIAIGNSGERAFVPAVERRLDDGAPLTRGAAVWALAELDAGRARRLKPEGLARESDPLVRAEWEAVA